MEAKGCAKPAVWKEARRHFYWATRARVACSNALGLLAAASPSQSREYLKQLLNDLSGVDEKSDHRAAAEALENLDLSSTVAQLKGDHIAQQFLGDRKSLIDGFVRLADCLSEDEKATVLAALSLRNTNTNTSPGPSDSRTLYIFLLIIALYYRTTVV
jgi:acetyl-CoA carboxylase/biotin carboxylase 1